MDSEQDTRSRTEYHGSQASYAHSVSPGLSEFQCVEASAKPGRSNRRTRRQNANPSNGDSLPRQISIRSDSIEEFEVLAPVPKPAPHHQRTARLISTTGSKKIRDSADEFILEDRSPKRHLNGLNKAKKRPNHELRDDGDEVVGEANGNAVSPIRTALQTGDSPKHSPPSLSHRGDLVPTKWARNLEPNPSLGFRVRAALCQPNLRYLHVEDQTYYFLRTEGEPELRGWESDNSPTEPMDWLKITEKAKTLHYHPDCDLIKISQSTYQTSSMRIGALLMIKFLEIPDLLCAVDWARKNLKVQVIQEHDSHRLYQTYDKLDQEVTRANGREWARRRSNEDIAGPPRVSEESFMTQPGLRDSASNNFRTPIRRQMQVSTRTYSSSRAYSSSETPSFSTRSLRNRRGVEQPEQAEAPVVRRWSDDHPDWAKDWQMPLVFHRTTVDKEDIARLDDGQLLNDNLIGFGLKYLFDKFGSRDSDLNKRVYVHNSFFYEKLKAGRGINYEGVKSWTAKVDLLSYDYIIVPVNEHYHWWVAIICNPGKLDPDSGDATGEPGEPNSGNGVKKDDGPADVEMTDAPEQQQLQSPRAAPAGEQSPSELHLVKSDIVDLVSDDKNVSIDLTSSNGPKQSKRAGPSPKKYNPEDPRIITLDSMGNNHSVAITHFKKYLLAEFEHKRNKIITQVPPGLGMKAQNIPQQNNLCDCGIYLLGYIQEFVKNPDLFIHTILQRERPDWEFDAAFLRQLWRDTIQIEQRNYQKTQLAAIQQKRGASAASRTPNGSVEPNGFRASNSREATNEPKSKSRNATGSPSQPPSAKASTSPTNPEVHEVDDSDDPDVEPLPSPQSNPKPANCRSPQEQRSQTNSLDDVVLLPPNDSNDKVLPSIEPIEAVDHPLPARRSGGDSPLFISKLSPHPSSSITPGHAHPATEVKRRSFYSSSSARSNSTAHRRAYESSPLRAAVRKAQPSHTESRFVVAYDDDDGPVVQAAELVRPSETIDLTD